MTQSSEVTQLVADARDGSRTAFDELVRVTYADTYTLAYRLTGNEEDAATWCRRRTSGPIEACASSAATRSSRRGCTASPRTVHPRTSGVAGATSTSELDDDSPVIDTRPEVDPQARADAAVTRSQLEAALARAAAPAPCGRGSARRLRPSPRGDRRRARHLGDGGEGSSAPSPSPSARAGVQPA